MKKPIPSFRAIYNPYLRHLVVKYGNSITEHTFKDVDEWCCINYNADQDNPNYLHIQIDYDETFQLAFYPRIENSDNLNENLGTYYNSGEKRKPRRVKIVHTDEEYENTLNWLGEYKLWADTEFFNQD